VRGRGDLKGEKREGKRGEFDCPKNKRVFHICGSLRIKIMALTYQLE